MCNPDMGQPIHFLTTTAIIKVGVAAAGPGTDGAR